MHIVSSIRALDFQMLVGRSDGLSTVLIFIHLYADPVISDGQTDILVAKWIRRWTLVSKVWDSNPPGCDI